MPTTLWRQVIDCPRFPLLPFTRQRLVLSLTTSRGADITTRTAHVPAGRWYIRGLPDVKCWHVRRWTGCSTIGLARRCKSAQPLMAALKGISRLFRCPLERWDRALWYSHASARRRWVEGAWPDYGMPSMAQVGLHGGALTSVVRGAVQAPLRSAPPVCGTTGGQVFGATNGDLDLRAGMVDGSFAMVHQHRTGAPEAPAHPMSRQRGRPLALVGVGLL